MNTRPKASARRCRRSFSLLAGFARAVTRLGSSGRCRTAAWLLLAGLVLPGAAQAQLGVSKNVAPGAQYSGTKYIGDTSAFLIRVSNNFSSGDITGVAFTDDMTAAGFRVAGGGAVTTSCVDGNGTAVGFVGTVTAPVGSQSIVFSGGVIPSRNGGSQAGYCDIVVEVTSLVAGGGENIIGVGTVTGTHNSVAVSNAAAAAQSINFETLSRPSLGKSFSPTTIVRLDQATQLTLTITNNSSQPLPLNNTGDTPGFALRDRLGDYGLAVAPTPATSINCGANPPTFVPLAGATTVTAFGGIVAANSTCTLRVNVVAAGVTNAYSTNITNIVDRNTDFGNRRGLVPASNASRSLTVTAPLQVEKSFDPASIAAGQQTTTLKIRLTNNSPLTTLSLGPFSDDIDGPKAGLQITAAPTATCTGTSSLSGLTGNGSQTVSYSSGTLSPNSYCEISVPYTATLAVPGTAESFTNTIPDGGVTVTAPADVFRQGASASVNVYDQLLVEKTRNPEVVAPGNPVYFTVTVSNFSIAPQTAITVTDTLPTGMNLLTAPQYPAPALTGGSGCVANSLAVGGSPAVPTFAFDMISGSNANPSRCTVGFWGMVPVNAAAGVTITNTLEQGDVCTAAGPGQVCNHVSNGAEFQISPGTLLLEKIFDAASKPEGTAATMTISLVNVSAQPLTGVSLTDGLPIGSNTTPMIVANPANASSTCAGATLTAVPGSAVVSLGGATVPARADSGTGSYGRCTLTVDVVGAAGTYVNSLPAGAASGTETLANGVVRPTSSPGPVNRSISFLPALGGQKFFSPAAIQPGGRATVNVRLSNSQPGVLTNVSVTDPLPTGMIVATPANAYTTCAGPTTISAAPGASSVSMSGAEIATGSCDLLFDITATGGGDWNNVINPGQLTAAGGVRNILPVSAVLQNVSGGGVTVGVNHASASIAAPGAATQLELTLFNGGSVDLTNLNLTNYFTVDGSAGGTPTGERIASVANITTTCTGAVIEAAPGSAALALSGVSLAAGQSCTVTADVTMVATGTVTTRIPVGSVSTDQGVTNSVAAASSLQTSSGVGVVKTFTPAVVAPNERSRLRITFYNPMPEPLTGLALTDVFPTGLVSASPANALNTCQAALAIGSTQVAVSGGRIDAGTGVAPASCYVELDVFSASQGDYVNTIGATEVSAVVGGDVVTNNQGSTDTLRVKGPLLVHKALVGLTLDSGNPLGFGTGTAAGSTGNDYALSIRFSNPNAAPLHGLAVTDTLPNGLVVAQTPAVTNDCGGVVSAPASATSVRLVGATLAANSSCTLTVNVLSNIAGTYTNSIDAGAVTTYEGVSNDDPSRARIVLSSPPTLSKQFEPAVIPQGGSSRLTLFIGNTNDAPLILSSNFTDTLPTSPGPVTVAATPRLGGTCPQANITANAGAAFVRLANGTSVPVGGCTIEVDVTASTPGQHNNIIASGALQSNFGSNPQPAYAPLSVNTLGFISGKVYRDTVLDGNGYTFGTDTPIAGAAIELRSGGSCAGPLVALPVNPVVTDGGGNYLFTGLPAGTYSVCQPGQPLGTLNGAPVAGSNVSVGGSTGSAGTPSNPTSGTPASQIAGIVLNGDGSGGAVSGSTGNNFAEVLPGSISGSVFADQNNDGVRQRVDPGLSGVRIELSGSDWLGNPVSAFTFTDNNGNYSFTGVPPGNYTVTQPEQPPGTANGITSAGSAGGTATLPTVTPSAIATIPLAPGAALTGYNFAEIPNGRSLFGRIFYDHNNNGSPDGIDTGIGGQTVLLTGTDSNGNPVSASTVTGADGSFAFTGLPAGLYTLTQPAQPLGTLNGITSAGSAGGTATPPALAPSQIGAIDLRGSGVLFAVDNWFAEIPPPDLVIAKTHTPAVFLAAGRGTYTLTPFNVGTGASSGTITVTDTLPLGLTAIGTPTGSGWSCAVAGQVITCTSAQVIGIGSVAAPTPGTPISVAVAVAGSSGGQTLVNSASVAGGGEPSEFAGNNSVDDPTPIDGTAATLTGTVWRDSNHDRVLDAGEPRLSGWTVELLRNGALVATTVSDEQGVYAFADVPPDSGYEVRFRHPQAGTVYGRPLPNEAGTTYTNGVIDAAANPAGADNSKGTLAGMTLVAGSNTVQQSLPVDPAGVIYDAISRQPVSGARIEINGPFGFGAEHVIGGALEQTTGSDGFYQFLLLAGAPAGTYTLSVTPPSGYIQAPSALIPVCAATLQVGALPDPALVQDNGQAPAGSAAAHDPLACASTSGGLAGGGNSTRYYVSFTFDGNSASLINNHIPIDPIGGAISITKTTPLVNVGRGGLVPYTVTATNTLSAVVPGVDVRDRMPAGFHYRSGSGSVRSGADQAFVAAEPTVSGRELSWRDLTFQPAEQKTFRVVLAVGAGVGEGEYTNIAWAAGHVSGEAVSNIASAVVRIIPEPVFDCADIIGKVFDDKNANGYQDQGEPGIANARVVTARGLLVTSDAEGRFHVPCAAIPQQDRGGNFVMKLDERTLPSGFRVTTENPRDVRVTRGKMVKINFGATVHKVFRVELDARAFAEGGTQLAAAWEQQLRALVPQLAERPAVVRLAYRSAGNEPAKLVKQRLAALSAQLKDFYRNPPGDPGREKTARPPLLIETETVVAAAQAGVAPSARGEQP